MKKKHEHNFRRSGMTLYCTCGMTQRIECAHKWKQEKFENIRIEKMGGELHQNEYTHVCTECGAVRHTNTTAGRTSIYR